MRFILNPLTTILTSFGNSEVPSSSETTHLHDISARRNPRATARSRSARLQPYKSAARLNKHRSTANATTNSSQEQILADTGTPRGTKLRDPKYRQTKMRRQAGGKPLRRCNTALVPQPVHPQPPGALTTLQSFIVPRNPGLDDRYLPPFTAQDIFFRGMQEATMAFLRAQEEREERKWEAEYARQLEQENEVRRRAADAEYLRQVEEDSRRAQEAHHRAMQEEFARQEAEKILKAKEASRRAEQERKRKAEQERKRKAEQERKRKAEQEARERERREHERLEQERRENERLERERLEQERRQRYRCEQERRDPEAAQPDFATQLRVYEEKWSTVRSGSDEAKPLALNDIPWPWFGYVQCLDDITDKRVLEFVGHSLRKHVQGGGGLARTLRFEMLRWHSDKFDKRVLDRVVGDDREAVKNAAGRVARILTDALNSC